MRKEKKLENLCNDFSNAHQLISIMSRGSVEQSNFTEVTRLQRYHNEMAYALDFVADALKEKADTLYSLIEDIKEDERKLSVEMSEEEHIILTLFRELDENGRTQTKGFMEEFKYRSEKTLNKSGSNGDA